MVPVGGRTPVTYTIFPDEDSELCYTVTMQSDRHIWQDWAHKLHSWGLGDWVASLLEAAGPLTLLGAQVIYLGQPFLGQVAPESRIGALVELFEEPEATRSFIDYLREETPQ
jgi:hypothetical protein